MPYKLDESRNAVSFTPGAEAGRGAPEFIYIHHWGIDGQSHDGVVNFFCTTAQTSAHYVASAGRVSCIVACRDVAWHAGDWPTNVRSIGIECRPEATAGDYATIAELIRDLRKVYGNLPLRPHSNQRKGTDGGYGSALTACPGRYDLAKLDALARGITTQGSKPITITPAAKDWFDMASKEEVKAALREVFGEGADSLPSTRKAGTRDWVLFNTREHAMAANNGAKANGKLLASIAAQTAAIKALSESKPGLDASAVQASIDKAVQAALKDLTVTLSTEGA